MAQQTRRRAYATYLAVVMAATAGSVSAASQYGNPDTASVEHTGKLEVIHIDDFEHQRSTHRYRIIDAITRSPIEFQFSGALPKDAVTGAFVRIRGKKKGQRVFLAADAPSSLEVLAPATTMVSGDQKTLVLVANFTDASVSCPIQEIQDRVFSEPTGQSVNNLYAETSLGAVSLSGSVAGPFQTGYSSTAACDLDAWTRAAEAQAQANGISLSQYARRIYVLPRQNACNYVGLGTVGGTPSQSWIFRCEMTDVYAHELGHNLGMGHSGTASGEYYDTSDIMSFSGWGLRQINAPHQEQMGWRTAPALQEISGSGTYQVATLETPPAATSAPQILKIRKPDTNEYYYLSYRQPIGLDANLDPSYLTGAALHRYTGTTAGTLAQLGTFLVDTFTDGERFSDEANGITVTQVDHTPNDVTVQVEFSPVCVRSAPLLTVAPASQTGGPGAALKYTLTVSNTDTSACPASTWAIVSQAPSGWVSAISGSALNLPGGGTASLEWQVTSAVTASDGDYRATVMLTDSMAGHSGSATANYTVARPADTSSPSAPGTLTGTSVRKQISLGWQAAKDNVAVAGYRVWRNDKLIATTANTSYADTAVVNGTTYRYYVVAFDAAGNVSVASNTVNIMFKRR